MKNFGLLKGQSGQIVACDGPNCDDDQKKCDSSACVAMELGVKSMDRYLEERHRNLSDYDRMTIAEKFLAMISTAQAKGVVLMDFKPSNVVRVVSADGDVFIKAIDFGSGCLETANEEITGDTTPAYSCPEVAKYMLAVANTNDDALSISKPLASHKMDVMALGWIVFELANDYVSYWKSLSPPLEKDTDILQALSKLSDKEVQHNIEASFPGDKMLPLRTWLCHALRVHPKQRATASELQAHSLFGSKDRTLDEAGITAMLSANFQVVTAVRDDMAMNHEQVIKTLDEMNQKLEILSETQDELGLVIRQVLVDSSHNHQELKHGLSQLNDDLLSNISTLQSGPRDNLDAMRDLIQSAVSNSMSSVQQNVSLTEDVKQLLVDTFKQCHETSQGANDSGKLDEIIKSLNHLQADVSNVMSQVAEIRGDLAQVNASLGVHLNMLSVLVDPKHNSPSMMIVLPAKQSMLSSFKGIFMKEMLIFFVCPVTKLPVKSGKDGKGYRLVLPTKFVKTVAPIIAVTFAIVDIALKVYGIPLPTIPLPKNMNCEELVSSLMGEMEAMVNDTMSAGMADLEEFADEFDSTKEAIEISKSATLETLSKSKKRKIDAAMQGASEASYMVIRDLLMDLEKCTTRGDDWRPKHTGLFKVTSSKDGKTAWVSEEAKEAFETQGMASMSMSSE